MQSPEYVKELVQHHVGGYLKIAPEHTEQGPLTKMMKPGIGSYDKFKQLFEKYSRRGRQEAVPDSVLHRRASGHQRRGHDEPGAVAEEERLPRRPGADLLPEPDGHRHRDVPHAASNPLRKITRRRARGWTSCAASKRRRLHKAFLRYHDANNWPLLREALKAMGRADLIGNGKHHLIPTFQPTADGSYQSARRKNSTAVSATRGRMLTQHTGLPPKATGSATIRPATASRRTRSGKS